MDSRYQGIVLSQIDYRENDLVLRIATTEGIIDVLAKGVKKVGAKNKAACQLFVLSEFMLTQPNQLARAVLTTADLIEDFRVSSHLESIAILSVVAEVLTSHFRQVDFFSELCDLLTASKNNRDLWLEFCWLISLWIKISGVGPQVDCCNNCAKTEICGISLSGGFVCKECFKAYDLRLEKTRLQLFRYLFKASEKDKAVLREYNYDWPMAEILMEYYLYHQPAEFNSWRFLRQLFGSDLGQKIT